MLLLWCLLLSILAFLVEKETIVRSTSAQLRYLYSLAWADDASSFLMHPRKLQRFAWFWFMSPSKYSTSSLFKKHSPLVLKDNAHALRELKFYWLNLLVARIVGLYSLQCFLWWTYSIMWQWISIYFDPISKTCSANAMTIISRLQHVLSSIAMIKPVFISCTRLGWELVIILFSSKQCSELHLQDKCYNST